MAGEPAEAQREQESRTPLVLVPMREQLCWGSPVHTPASRDPCLMDLGCFHHGRGCGFTWRPLVAAVSHSHLPHLYFPKSSWRDQGPRAIEHTAIWQLEISGGSQSQAWQPRVSRKAGRGREGGNPVPARFLLGLGPRFLFPLPFSLSPPFLPKREGRGLGGLSGPRQT